MERRIYAKMTEWRNRRNRKPLVLMGSRQVGKTWLMHEFCRANFKRVHEFNFDSRTDLSTIFKDSKEYGLKKPELKDFGTSFRINIFRKEAETDQYGVVKPADLSTADSGSTTKETTKEILMRAMRENPAITVKELAPIVGLTEDGVRYHIKKMRAEGKLEREGSTKAGKWIVKA